MESLKTKNGSSNVSTALDNAASQPEQTSTINTPWGKIFSGYANENRRNVERNEKALSVTGADDALLSERELNRSNKRVVRSVQIIAGHGDNATVQEYLTKLAELGVIVTPVQK